MPSCLPKKRRRMPNIAPPVTRCASCCSTSRTWTGCWAKTSARRRRKRSMTGNNGHAPKRFGETRSHTFMCVQRVSGALPLTSRGRFSQWRKLPEKQSGCRFALLATFVPNSVQKRLYRVFCYTEIEGKDRITRGFRPQKLGITNRPMKNRSPCWRCPAGAKLGIITETSQTI